MLKIFQSVAGMKMYLGFWLTFISIIGTFALAFMKNTDISITLPAILAIYISNKSLQKISGHFNSARDPACDTRAVIEKLDEKE